MPMLPFACARSPPAPPTLLPASACARAAQVPELPPRKPASSGAPARRRASRTLSLGYSVPPLTELGVLGEGACGCVLAARPKEGGPMVAVKRLPKDSAPARRAAVREARVMRSLDHDSICRLREVCEDRSNVYLVMEHIEGFELFDQVGAFGLGDEQTAREIMRQLLEALAHCHESDVVHLDVKPENVMVAEPHLEGDSPVVKLIDFGLAVQTATPTPSAAAAGPYSAPEVREGTPAQPSADVWSAGAVMHVLLTGALPPPGVAQGLEPLDFHSALSSAVPPAARELLRDMLSPDPSARPSAAEAATKAWLGEGGAWADGGASVLSEESLDSLLFDDDLGGLASGAASTCGSLPPMEHDRSPDLARAFKVDVAWPDSAKI